MSTSPHHMFESTNGIQRISNYSAPYELQSKDDLLRFVETLRATDVTFARYAGVRRLPFWEALALHQYLDPILLNIGQIGRLTELEKISRLTHDAPVPLNSFLYFLEKAKYDVSVGELRLIGESNDPLVGCISLKDFEFYAGMRRIPNTLLSALDRRSEVEKLEKVPVFIQCQLDVLEMWRKSEAGGYKHVPDARGYFAEHEFSDHLCAAMATLCRPEKSPFGRPRGKGIGSRDYSKILSGKSV